MDEHTKAMFYAQAIFGALALAAILFAAISWGERDAMFSALGSCLAVVMSQHSAMMRQVKLALVWWWSAVALAALAAVLL